MSISEEGEYRLLHKKDGTYVLQNKQEYYRFDKKIGKLVCGVCWVDLKTVEEEDEFIKR